MDVNVNKSPYLGTYIKYITLKFIAEKNMQLYVHGASILRHAIGHTPTHSVTDKNIIR